MTAIHACIVCGSRELRWPSAADGAALGDAANLNERVCNRGHKGVPLWFDRESDWQAFVDSLRLAKATKPAGTSPAPEPAAAPVPFVLMEPRRGRWPQLRRAKVILACLQCGSQNLRGWNRVLCRDCRWRGIPVEFDDEASWRSFRDARARDKAEGDATA